MPREKWGRFEQRAQGDGKTGKAEHPSKPHQKYRGLQGRQEQVSAVRGWQMWPTVTEDLPVQLWSGTQTTGPLSHVRCREVVLCCPVESKQHPQIPMHGHNSLIVCAEENHLIALGLLHRQVKDTSCRVSCTAASRGPHAQLTHRATALDCVTFYACLCLLSVHMALDASQCCIYCCERCYGPL